MREMRQRKSCERERSGSKESEKTGEGSARKSMARDKKPVIRLDDDNFGAVLNWAVRYCLGRMTYAPSMTIEFITPLLPHLSNKALRCFDMDIADHARYGNSFGMACDEREWMRFWDKVKEEIGRRKANV